MGLCPKHRRHLLGYAAQVHQVQGGDAEHQVGDPGIHVLPQPRGYVRRGSEDGVLVDIKGGSVVSV